MLPRINRINCLTCSSWKWKWACGPLGEAKPAECPDPKAEIVGCRGRAVPIAREAGENGDHCPRGLITLDSQPAFIQMGSRVPASIACRSHNRRRDEIDCPRQRGPDRGHHAANRPRRGSHDADRRRAIPTRARAGRHPHFGRGRQGRPLAADRRDHDSGNRQDPQRPDRDPRQRRPEARTKNW